MGRFENVRVFEDTVRLCSQGRLKSVIENSIANQELILQHDAIKNVVAASAHVPRSGHVVVSAKRTLEAAVAYRDKRVAVLNFASASNPGGGVVSGSSAQEEALCRISTLYFTLNTKQMWDGFYGPHRAERNPLHNDDIIYTPDVVVFKSDTESPELLAEDAWHSVDVITCAAPNLRERPSNQMNSGDGDCRVQISQEKLYDLHLRRFTRILQVASAKGVEVLVLGAFGCGAFRNDPKVVARAAHDALDLFRTAFEVIEFAVYCLPWGNQENYQAFVDVMEK